MVRLCLHAKSLPINPRYVPWDPRRIREVALRDLTYIRLVIFTHASSSLSDVTAMHIWPELEHDMMQAPAHHRVHAEFPRVAEADFAEQERRASVL